MMFGISPVGWLHTLGSLPAIPLAIYMLVRYGRITPRGQAGITYLIFMLVGAFSVFLVAKQTVSYGIGVATLLFLALGYSAGHISFLGRGSQYVETISLSITTFLLMVPAVSETLRRVPDGHPLVTDLASPLLLGAQGALFVILIVGVIAQIVMLRKSISHFDGT